MQVGRSWLVNCNPTSNFTKGASLCTYSYKWASNNCKNPQRKEANTFLVYWSLKFGALSKAHPIPVSHNTSQNLHGQAIHFQTGYRMCLLAVQIRGWGFSSLVDKRWKGLLAWILMCGLNTYVWPGCFPKIVGSQPQRLMHVTLRLLACDEPQGRLGWVFGPGQNCWVEGELGLVSSPEENGPSWVAGWLAGRPLLASQPASKQPQTRGSSTAPLTPTPTQ